MTLIGDYAIDKLAHVYKKKSKKVLCYNIVYYSKRLQITMRSLNKGLAGCIYSNIPIQWKTI